MKALINFILSNAIRITKTKANKGFMIYNLKSQPSYDSAKLKSLVESIGWSFKKFAVKRDADDNVISDARIYCGPMTASSWDIDKDSVADFLNDQG